MIFLFSVTRAGNSNTHELDIELVQPGLFFDTQPQQ